MRSSVLLLVAAITACASTPGDTPRSGSGTTVQRQAAGATLVGPQGTSGSHDYSTTVALETKSYPVAVEPAAIWGALPAAYQSLGIPLAALDSATMTVGNPGLAVRGGRIGERRVSRYLNCGSDPLTGPIADRAEVRLSVLSHVRPAGAGAVIEVQVSGTAVQRSLSNNAVTCTSTGVLEEALATAAKLELVR